MGAVLYLEREYPLNNYDDLDAVNTIGLDIGSDAFAFVSWTVGRWVKSPHILRWFADLLPVPVVADFRYYVDVGLLEVLVDRLNNTSTLFQFDPSTLGEGDCSRTVRFNDDAVAAAVGDHTFVTPADGVYGLAFALCVEELLAQLVTVLSDTHNDASAFTLTFSPNNGDPEWELPCAS